MPPPIGDHALPLKRAMLFAGTPPAVVNRPPATRSPFASVVSDQTIGGEPPVKPVPSADQLVPSKRAMLLTGTPPAVVNAPPTTMSPLARTVVASAVAKPPLTPAPSGDHPARALKRATRFAGLPPAVVNAPTAIRSPF